jgi:hypothetical protein
MIVKLLSIKLWVKGTVSRVWIDPCSCFDQITTLMGSRAVLPTLLNIIQLLSKKFGCFVKINLCYILSKKDLAFEQ